MHLFCSASATAAPLPSLSAACSAALPCSRSTRTPSSANSWRTPALWFAQLRALTSLTAVLMHHPSITAKSWSPVLLATPSPCAARFSVRSHSGTYSAFSNRPRPSLLLFSGSKVASRCKLDDFIADAAAWRVRIAAKSRQRQLFDEVIGPDAAHKKTGASDARDPHQNKAPALLPSKGKQKGKDEIDELFDAVGTEAKAPAGDNSNQAARAHGSLPVPIPRNCDPSVAAVLSALSGGSKKRKHK